MRTLLQTRLNRHFRAAAALAAAASVGGAVASARGAIVYSGPVSINIPSTTAGVYLNLVTGVNDPAPGNVPGWDVDPWSSGDLNMFSPVGGVGGFVGTATTYFNLTPGTQISGASVFSGSGTATPDPSTPLNLNSSSNLMGFKFQNENNGNQIHYGWIRVSLSTSSFAQPRAIVEYAYEDVAGQAIGAGVTSSDPNAGACCKADGTCTFVNSTDCANLGGTFTSIGTNCVVSGCATRCCLTDGTCQLLTPTACTTAGGVSTLNSTCANACPQPGACCLTNGTCTNTLPSSCTAQNGFFRGGGSVCASTVCGAAFPEVEPNETKATATPVNFVAAQDYIRGNTTGAVTTAGATSLDQFLVKTPAMAPGIYRNRLTIETPGTAGHTGTIRGLNQTGATAGPWPGPVGTPGVTDSTVQTSSTTSTPARMCQWYGFGKQEQIYYRVTGGTTTTSDYAARWTVDPVTPTDLGSFLTGQITISSVGQGHTTDTDLWVYDSSFNAIDGFGNDGSSTFGGAATANSTPSWLRRTYADGTYYVGIANTNIANNKGSPCDDNLRTGLLLDFPDAAANSSTTTAVNIGFAVTDSSGTVPVTAVRNGVYDVNWYKFTVSGAPATRACCKLDGTCQEMTVASCTAGGGVANLTSTCAGVSCPQPGACCRNDGTCTLSLPSQCVTVGNVVATFAGGGVTCAAAACGKYSVVSNIAGTFTDITATGTPFTTLVNGSLDDGTYAFTSSVTNALVNTANLTVSTNGDISNLPTFTGFTNTVIPNTTAGLTLCLYAMWDDLDNNSPSQLLHLATTENNIPVEIIQWNTFHHGFTTNGTLQAKIFGPGGPALVQYIFQDLAWNWNGNSATIGVQWAGDRAFQYTFGTTNAAGGPIPNNAVLSVVAAAACYANCDNSTQAPILNIADFTCYLQKFAASDAYANCDNSTQAPVLNIADFTCFLQKFAAGCS